MNIVDPATLIFMTVGVGAGLLAGSIPGFTIAMAIVLTLFSRRDAASSRPCNNDFSFAGGLSGGLMSGILTGIPGTPSSVATTFDGFPMARNGEPGLASVLESVNFFVAALFLQFYWFFAPQLAAVGLEFQPWDFFMLVMFALICYLIPLEAISSSDVAGAAGLLIRTVGEDDAAGVGRFDFI